MQLQCGNWRLESEIGHGAYGTVYLAVGPEGERTAVKVCRRDAVGDERYERELRGASLYWSIPPQEGLVGMWEFGEKEWGFYIVMDLADDEFGRPLDSPDGYRPKTLASVIAGEKALPLKECVKLALSLANGLAALQRHHLLHRDIKPGNVLYVCGRLVLSDPGLVVEESAATSLVGTPGYVPPEKFIDPASDIYSLGLTLKAASFGRRIEDLDKGPAMEADTGAARFPAWWRILNKATDPTPSRRYQSAKALVKDLKTLHLKTTVTLVNRSWILYTAIGIILFLAIAFKLAIVADKLEKREKMEEAMEKEALRGGQWLSMELGHSMASVYQSRLDWPIQQVSATNKTLGTELQSLLDKIMDLDKKYEAAQDEIRLQDDVARNNRKNGLSDEKEFELASKLEKEKKKIDKEMRSIYSEICVRLGVIE